MGILVLGESMKKRPRIPKPIRNPVEVLALRNPRMTEAQIAEQRDLLMPAIHRLCTGNWLELDWGAVRDAANRTEVLMRHARVEDPTLLLDVSAVIQAAKERHRTRGTKALYPREAEVLRWIAEGYMQVLTEITKGQFDDACAEVDREVNKIVAMRRNAEIAQRRGVVA
jgi:hypothetical protein